MLVSKYTATTMASPSQIWRVFEDVENWKSWDYEVEFSRMNGPFEAGTRGQLKMQQSPKLETQLTYVDPLKKFVLEAKLLFATAVMTHTIARVDGKTQVTFQTDIRGPFTLLYARMIGGSIKKKTPAEMERMLIRAFGLPTEALAKAGF